MPEGRGCARQRSGICDMPTGADRRPCHAIIFSAYILDQVLAFSSSGRMSTHSQGGGRICIQGRPRLVNTCRCMEDVNHANQCCNTRRHSHVPLHFDPLY